MQVTKPRLKKNLVCLEKRGATYESWIKGSPVPGRIPNSCPRKECGAREPIIGSAPPGFSHTVAQEHSKQIEWKVVGGRTLQSLSERPTRSQPSKSRPRR